VKRAGLLFTILGAVLLAGVWRVPGNLGGKDWNWFLGQTEAELTSLVRFGQLPLWSPWRHGGQVCFAQPESMFLSPVTPLALLCGTLLAFKLLLLPVYVAGALGMVALAGELGLSGRARLVPALVFFCSSIAPLYVLAGLPNWLCALALLPWLLWALRRARRDLRWLALAGALDAGLLLCGAIYWFTLFPLLLALDGACASVLRRSVRPALLAGIALLVGVVLAAPRIVPLFEVHGQHPRELAATGYFMPPSLVLPAWLSTDWPDLSTPNGSFLINDESAVYWPFVGAWVGPLALLLAALGVVAGGRRAAIWWLAGAVSLWAAFGSGVRPSLWELLHALPGIASMHVPARLMLLASFCLALLAGFGWERVELWLAHAGRRRALAGNGLLVLLVAPMLWVNAPLSAQAFTVTPAPEPGFAREFLQQRVPQRPEQWLGESFQSVRANVGNPLAATDIPTPQAVRTDDAPDYRGEVYLLRAAPGSAVRAELTPNRIEVALETPEPDLLVVNQNWFPGWRAERLDTAAAAIGAAREHEGLLAVEVPAGRTRLAFVFDPPGARRGMLLGALGLAAGLAWLWARRRTPRDTLDLPAAPEWLAAGAFGLLAVAVAGTWVAPAGEGAAAHVAEESAAWFAAGTRVPPPASPDEVRDLQPMLADQPPGTLLLVPPGRYAGFTLARGLTLAALPGGAVEVVGPVAIGDLPADERLELRALAGGELHLLAGLTAHDAAGELWLQHAQLGAPASGLALAAERCARVLLVDVHGGAASLDACGASLLRCELRGAAGHAALAARESTLLVREGRLAGGEGGLPALRVDGGTLRADAATLEGGGRGLLSASGPALVLEHGASAWVGGLPDLAARAQVAPGCTLALLPADSPRVRVVESRYGGGTLLLELSGAPGSAGAVILSHASVLQSLPPLAGTLPDGATLLADLAEGRAVRVILPATGTLTRHLRIPSALRRPGSAVIAQFLSVSAARVGNDAAGASGTPAVPAAPVAWRVSLPDATLLELRGVRP